MEKKQLLIKDLERDLSLKITALKKEQKVFNTLAGLKRLMEEESQKDEVVMILDKLQTFTEKQLAEEIEAYEEALIDLRNLAKKEPDMETNGGVC